MPNALSQIAERAKKLRRAIVLPEADRDERVFRAASLVLERGWAIPVLLGRREDFTTSAESLGISIKGARFIYPTDDPAQEAIITRYEERRAKEGLTRDQIRAAIMGDSLLYGAGLAGIGLAHGMVAGAASPTADVLRAAIKLVGVAEGFSTVSSYFLMELPECADSEISRVLIFADCAVVPDPSAEQLADIAISASEGAAALLGDFEPRIAMLSFSTHGSANHPLCEKVVTATRLVRERRPGLAIDGELQADAALVAAVRVKKAPRSQLRGAANVLIFPGLEAGNIGYKIVQRLAGAKAIGPILTGLSRPVNDLSRGASIEEIAETIAVTAASG